MEETGKEIGKRHPRDLAQDPRAVDFDPKPPTSVRMSSARKHGNEAPLMT